MPHATDFDFDHIKVKQLAPTFGAEVTGIDFSKPVSPQVFAEVHKAITQVS
jgi:alpha-ketoglutarate-dependent 2,4-dichlorophenoxyacetate dioxygenase